MKKRFLLVGAFLLLFLGVGYSENTRNDSCILDIAEVTHKKYRINTKKTTLSDKEITLHSDRFGPISLCMIISDNEGVWTSGYCSDQCSLCGKYYNYKPSECHCGSKEFKPVETIDK